MKKVLITGAGGFIGRHLARSLLDDKDSHLILNDKWDPGYNPLENSESRNRRVSFSNLDITNRKAVLELFGNEKIDTCIHLAAQVNVEDSVRDPDKTMDVNVKGTLNILDACSYGRTDNLIFASSAAVYGHPIKLPIAEEDLLAPISPYGISKLLAEQYVSLYMSSKKIRNALSLRIFNAYGQGQSGNVSVITKFAKRLSSGLSPIIYGNGMQKRDFISISDVVNAFLLSIKAIDERSERLLSTPSWIFNIGTGIGTSIKDLCDEMIRSSGLDIQPIYQETSNEADIKASCADITKAQKILKFVPKNKLNIDLKDILTSTISTPVK